MDHEQTVCSGDHRRRRHGQQGHRRHGRRLSRERAKLERNCCLISSAGAQETGPELAVGDGAFGLLEGATRGLRRDQGAALLGPQDAPTCSTRCPNPCRPSGQGPSETTWWCGPRLGPTPKPPIGTCFIVSLRRKIPRRPQSAWSRTVNAWKELLRLPGRALEAHPHHQPHRKHLRQRCASRTVKTKGCLSAQDGARHGLQTDLECQAEIRGQAGRIKSTRPNSSKECRSRTESR